MNKKNKKDINVNYYNEPVFVDEMQRAVSNELEHRSLRLWYVLNSLIMFFTYLIFMDGENFHDTIPKAVQNMFLMYFGAMYFCLSLYNLRAAYKGVLDSFSPFQKGSSGWLYLLGFTNIFIPTQPIVSYLIGDSDNVERIRPYLTFFIIWACMAWAFYIIASYSVYLNKKFRDNIAADEENEEE